MSSFLRCLMLLCPSLHSDRLTAQDRHMVNLTTWPHSPDVDWQLTSVYHLSSSSFSNSFANLYRHDMSHLRDWFTIMEHDAQFSIKTFSTTETFVVHYWLCFVATWRNSCMFINCQKIGLSRYQISWLSRPQYLQKIWKIFLTLLIVCVLSLFYKCREVESLKL